MSLWGNSDNLTIPGAPTSVDIVGTASSEFWTAAGLGVTLVPSGTTMILGNAFAGEAGMAVVEAPLVDEDGQLVTDVVKINILSAVPGTWDVKYAQQPIQISHDPGFNGWSKDGGGTVSGAAVVRNPDFAEIGRTQMAVGVGTTEMAALQPPGDQPAINFHLDHSGWVGVMTYMSLDPETGISTMRVKKEVYVAMSGIETGNRPYPDVFGVSV